MLSVYVKSIIVFTFQLLDRTDEHHKLMKIENECAPVMLSTGDLSAVKIKVPLPTCISKQKYISQPVVYCKIVVVHQNYSYY